MVASRITVALLASHLAIFSTCSIADEPQDSGDTVRVLSWNISGDAHTSQPQEFSALLRWAAPDVVLLDEVYPSTSDAELLKSIDTLRPDVDDNWTIDIGVSGGRQRCVIASRTPQEPLPEFSSIIPYPDADRHYLLEHMSDAELDYRNYGLDGGIPVNGAIILDGEQRLLIIVTDLQCCGDDQNSWQEYRRRAEVRVIRELIKKVLKRTSVDGVLIAGDLNLVNGPLPLISLSKPYEAGRGGLLAAELYHPNGSESWTWDGRETPFPSGTLDFQLYDSTRISMRSGYILDTEDMPAETLKKHGLQSGTASETGRHRPLLVEYVWR